MKDKINTYFAILIIAIAGAAAAWIIIQTSNSNASVPVVSGNEASYASLKQLILKPQTP